MGTEILPRPMLALRRSVEAHPRLAAIALGLVAALGYPPLALWPLALVAIAGFIILLHRRKGGWREAALLGWLFGWSHLTLANNWIATAFTHQAQMPAALGWLAVPLLCLYLALYPALAAGLARRLAPDASLAGFSLALAGSWILAEWLRGWVFTGYPWPPLGLILLGDFSHPGIARLLPYLGTYALSGLVVLLAGAIALVVANRHWLLAGGLAALLLAAMWLPAGKEGQDSAIAFVLVQPDIAQDDLHDPARFEEHFARLARLTMPGNDRARLVLWPESAVPDYLREGYPHRYYERATAFADPVLARRRIAAVIGKESLLLTGAIELIIAGEGAQARAVGAHNSVLAIDGQGNIRASYAKAHLVPFGEYLPLREWLEPIGLARLVPGAIDFVPGPGPRTLDLGALGQVGVQICYEIVFPGHIVDRASRPDYIFNPSNDGWFGAWGPPQHLAQARMRAIEEGLPVLRATTTGISAVIDAQGRVREHLAPGEEGRIEGFVPSSAQLTPFARWGNALSLGWALSLLLISMVAMRRRGV